MYRSIKTKAELKRLPEGTELTLVNNLLGKVSTPRRTIKQIRSQDIILTLEDGRESFMYLEGCTLQPTDDGFKLIDRLNGVLCAEYKVKEN